MATPIAQTAGTPQGAALVQAARAAVNAARTYADSLPDDHPNVVPAQRCLNSLLLVLANILRGQATATVAAPPSSSLYELAVMKYGDISDAFALGDANLIPSMRLPNYIPTPVALPPYSSSL